MWIQAPDNWRSIAPVKDDAPDDFDEPIDFNDNGSANVSESIGNYLVQTYDQISEYDNEDDN